MKILITLNKDRNLPGTLEVTGADFGQIACLGRSDGNQASLANNPTRSPLKRMGDIPAGRYTARVWQASGRAGTFGPYRRLLLDGIEGDALTAKLNGRSELMIHGGGPSKNGSRGGLRPTFGCVRVTNPGMLQILDALDRARLTQVEVLVVEKD